MKQALFRRGCCDAVRLFLLSVGLACAALTSVHATDFSGWPYRASVTFSGYNKAETLTNFPALVTLGTNISGFSYALFASTNGGDFRFSDSTLTNELNYEIERWSSSRLRLFGCRSRR